MQTLSKLLAYNIKTIAFVDSLDHDSEMLLPDWEAEMLGYTVIAIPPYLVKLSEVVAFIQQHAQAAVCTNRLGYEQFCGAELVAALYDAGVPALLVTQYLEIDQHSSIRLWRSRLPVVLSLRDFCCDTLTRSLALCVAELQGRIPEERIPYRVMLCVEHVEGMDDTRSVDVSIDYWDHYQRLRLPLKLIPRDLWSHVAPHTWFFAYVNVHAQKAAELYFRDFALAPEPCFDENLTYCINAIYDPCPCEYPLLWFEQHWHDEQIFDVTSAKAAYAQLN